MRVAIIGGAGALGGALSRALADDSAISVTVIDKVVDANAHPEARYLLFDAHDVDRLRHAVRGQDIVVHLAALHGAHLAAGATAEECWRSNAVLTRSVVQATVAAGVGRLLFASSTSVYGDGATVGTALVLDESTVVRPSDIYDQAKLAAEAEISKASESLAGGATTLRLGRFFKKDEVDYQLRKLSTGLDLSDAVAAFQAVIPFSIPADLYCVASDLPLPREVREEMGVDLSKVVANHFPRLAQLVERGELSLPERVAKSVMTEKLRMTTGWSPKWTVEDWAQRMMAINETSLSCLTT